MDVSEARLICPNCARDIPESAETCPECGVALGSTLAGAMPRLAPASGGVPDAPRGPVAARFLLSPVLAAPVPLEPGGRYRIGRDRASAVFFPSNHVSRIHAEIVEEKGRWVVSDLGSRNGTFVNGERVLKRALRHGDRIGVGQFELAYCEATDDEARALLDRRRGGTGGETQPIELGGGDFFGELANVSITEVIQLLNHNRKTGCLGVREKGHSHERRLYFCEGEIVHAEHEQLEGEKALDAIFKIREGRFAFRPLFGVPRRTISISTSTLLLKVLGAP
jgi:pSer/pThr/pTyr-binding forkhead associated (FHA) protein